MNDFDNCCVCLGDYGSPICMRKSQHCPRTRIKITTKIPNNFVEKFFRGPTTPNVDNELIPIRYVVEYGVEFRRVWMGEVII